jgi:hypothetical protein
MYIAIYKLTFSARCAGVFRLCLFYLLLHELVLRYLLLRTLHALSQALPPIILFIQSMSLIKGARSIAKHVQV